MPADLHETSLIALLAIGFVLALRFGIVANLPRVSPIVGYLVAGIAVGPFTPGFVGDPGLANQISEIGVILLMFGAGLHFSIQDLTSVRRIALPGAVAQIATAIGASMAHQLGWGVGVGLLFGLSLSVASIVVLLRALEEGKIAVGWRIVEVSRALNPRIDVVVRTHNAAEIGALEALGAGRVVKGERALASAMTEHTPRGLGVPPERARVAAGRDALPTADGR